MSYSVLAEIIVSYKKQQNIISAASMLYENHFTYIQVQFVYDIARI